MKTKIIALLGAAMILLMAGCALTTVTLEPVGPAPVNTTPAAVPTAETTAHCGK